MERFITVTRSKSVRNANNIQNETNESVKDRDLSISNAEDTIVMVVLLMTNDLRPIV